MQALRLLSAQRFQLESVFLFLFALLLFMYQDTVSSLYHLWYQEDNPTYSHGLLLLAVSIYLFVKRWQILKPCFRLDLNLFGVVLVFLASLLWVFASLGNIQVAQQFMVLLLVSLLVNALFGRAVALSLAFPVLLMICAMPGWEVVNDSLRQLAVVSVTFLLGLSGFLVVSEGYNILVSAGVFQVDVGCSGLNQFVVACAVGFLYGYVRQVPGQIFGWRSVLSYGVVVAIALLFAVLANILRIYIVVVAGQLSNMQHYFVTTDHVMLGWVVFAVFMFAYFYLMERVVFERLPITEVHEDFPEVMRKSGAGVSCPKKITQVGLIVLSIILGPVYLNYLMNRTPTIELAKGQQIDFPNRLQSWQRIDAPTKQSAIVGWQPDIQGADLSGSARYMGPAGPIELYVYHYYVQHQGKEAVHESNRLTNTYWSQKSVQDHGITVAGDSFEIKESILSSTSGDHRLVWDWYSVGGISTANPYFAKIVNTWHIFGGRPEITHFVIATSVTADDLSARLLLSRFLEGAGTDIENLVVQ